jgi:hypothetical protein
VVLLAYAILKFGTPDTNLGLAMVARGIAYAVTIYLYFEVARAAKAGNLYFLLAAFAIALTVSLLVADARNRWLAVFEWGMVIPTAITVGLLSARSVRAFRQYVAGLAVIVFFGLCWVAVFWSDLKVVIEYLEHRDIMADAFGFSVPAAYADAVGKMMRIIGRLWPGLTIMAVVTQFSIGYLWFGARQATESGDESPLKSFLYWRMPREALALFALGAAALLVPFDAVKLAGENLLFALSVFYCVTGLAVLEYHLYRLRVHLAVRIVIYVALIPTGLIGYLALGLIGLINSGLDWRRKVAVD